MSSPSITLDTDEKHPMPSVFKYVQLNTSSTEPSTSNGRVLLVGMDGFTSSSLDILSWTLSNFAHKGDSIVCLSVIPPVEVERMFYLEFMKGDESSTVKPLQAELDKISTMALKKFQEVADSFKEKVNLNYLAIDIRIGEPKQILLSESEVLKADALVVGSRGLGPIKKLLLGSTSDHLIHHSNVPVIVVRN